MSDEREERDEPQIEWSADEVEAFEEAEREYRERKRRRRHPRRDFRGLDRAMARGRGDYLAR